jgi:hypothetical protein
VSSTVGSLVGHAQGSDQLLGMHTLQIPSDYPLKVCPQSALTGT